MKLASIQTITEIHDIAGADRIQCAIVRGYKSVIKKGEYKVGDTCVFIEPDTILPDKPWSAFLKDKNRPDKPIRLRATRFKGCVSQGLIVDITSFNDGFHDYNSIRSLKDGADVTELIGVTKYEKPIPVQLMGEVKGNFPTSIIPKTDEPRYQICKGFLDECQNFNATMKLDGTSVTFLWLNDEFTVCSRNLIMKDGDTAYWNIARKYDIQNKLPKNLAIQGEIVGEKIQGNPMGIKGLEFYVFNVFERDTNSYSTFSEFKRVCEDLGFPHVPLLEGVDYSSWEALQEYANKLTYPNGKPAEGIVIRSDDIEYSFACSGRPSCKVISETFLLENNE